MKKAVVLVGLLLGGLALSRINRLANIEYDISDLTVKNFGFNSIEAEITLTVYNPSPVPVLVTDVFMNISYEGQPVGVVKELGPLTIQPQAQSRVNIPVSLFTSSAINALIMSLMGRGFTGILITGTMRAGGAKVPVYKKY